jgi:hypothetical protein
MRQNARFERDVLADVEARGAAPKDPLVTAGRKSGDIVVETFGEPKQPVPIRTPDGQPNLQAAAAMQQQAAADTRAGGFWTVTGSVALDVVGALASLAGLTGAGVWIKRLRDGMLAARAAVDTAEAKAGEFAEKLTTVSGAYGALSRAVDKAGGGEASPELRKAMVEEIQGVEGLTIAQAQDLHMQARSKVL